MRLTERAHTELKKFLNPGDQVIDATTGNGYDTVFLARQVGTNGKVFAFDLQAESIEESTRLIEAEKLVQRVTFFPRPSSRCASTAPASPCPTMINSLTWVIRKKRNLLATNTGSATIEFHG